MSYWMNATFAICFAFVAMGCGPQDPNATPAKPVEALAGYGVKVTSFAEQMQKQVADLPLPEDTKAQAMVKFRDVGKTIEQLGQALSLYDAAVKANEPLPTGTTVNDILDIATRVRAGVAAILPLTKVDPAVHDQVNTTFSLLEQTLLELQTKLQASKVGA